MLAHGALRYCEISRATLRSCSVLRTIVQQSSKPKHGISLYKIAAARNWLVRTLELLRLEWFAVGLGTVFVFVFGHFYSGAVAAVRLLKKIFA